MSNDIVTSAWGPGLIGASISGCMYGVSLAQSAYYLWYFANDLVPIKLLVLFITIADAIHLIGVTESYWNKLVSCHRRDVATCETDLTWGGYVAVLMNYVITFAVQCFYCQRVWIITGGKRGITAVIFVVAFVQFALGIWATIETLKHGSIAFLETSPLVPLAAAVSTICDIVITITIFKHLWRSELRGRVNVVRDLVIVFINMGALTWQVLISIIVGVVFLLQGKHYWIGAPAVIIPRCYVNSFLAVLNARHTIRERETRRLRYTFDVPTLPTIV